MDQGYDTMTDEQKMLSTDKHTDRILLKFDYNEPLKDELKTIIRFPNCKWDSENRAWSIKDDPIVIDAAFAIFEKYGVNADALLGNETSDSDKEVIANWYSISEIDSEYYSYYVDLPDTKDIQAQRYRLVNKLINLNESIHVALDFDKIITTEKLSAKDCDKHSLRFNRKTSTDKAHEVMFREVLKKQLGDDEYDNMYGRLISKRPICESGDYELYQKHEMRVRSFGEARVLQVRNSTIRSTKATIKELSESGKSITLNQKLKHTYDGTVCQFHGYAEGTADGTPLDQLNGLTLLELFERDSSVDRSKLSAVKSIRGNKASRLVKVSYSNAQRQKGDYRTSAECLLKEVVDNDALPRRVAIDFMKHSHVPIRERFMKSMRFRINLENATISDKISKKMSSIKDLGFHTTNFDKKNITFGGSEVVNWSARDLSSSFRKYGALNPVKKHIRVSFIPFTEFTDQHQKFVNRVMNYLERGCDSCEFIGPEKPYSEFNLNEARLSREYEGIEDKADIVLIELDERDDVKWQVWKKAANRINIRNQMLTSQLIHDTYAPMNIAFGIIGKLGGITFTAHTLQSEIEMWIGLDVGRRPGSNLGASCVAFEANGKQIGWAAPEILQGERITPKAFRNILTNIIEEVNILRERENRSPLKTIGILRDGRFYELISVIEEIEKQFAIDINVFEVRKSGAPRLAIRQNLEISACSAGTCVWKDDWGFLQPSQERSRMGSPTILQIRSIKTTQKIDSILHDVFWLSKMHVGTTMQPGLPVPIHYADRLSKYAGLGVIRNPSFTTNLDFL
jgi:hypothetical protein